MTTAGPPAHREPTADRSSEPLRPFSGLFSPGIHVSSGHCCCFYKWWSSPTPLGPYESVWVIAPDGERRLYVDPPDAGPYVETYHGFDRTVEAEVEWERADEAGLRVRLDAADGTTLDLRADLGDSVGTRLLSWVTSLTPTPVLRTSVGKVVSNVCFGALIDANGLKVAGVTDTQEPYRVEADALRTVTDVSATLDGEDLGEPCPPERPIEFGDAKVPNEPFVAFGDLHLRPP